MSGSVSASSFSGRETAGLARDRRVDPADVIGELADALLGRGLVKRLGLTSEAVAAAGRHDDGRANEGGDEERRVGGGCSWFGLPAWIR